MKVFKITHRKLLVLAKEEQQKEEEIRGKQKTPKKKEKKEAVTFEEAKKMAYDLIQQGWAFNKIAKRRFEIKGRGFIHFSISQLSRIKHEREGEKSELKNRSNSENVDIDKAKVFNLLDKGKTPAEIISKEKFSPEFVKKVRDNYVELSGSILCPKSILEKIKHLMLDDYGLTEQDYPNSKIGFEDILHFMEWLKGEFDDYENRSLFYCRFCKKLTPFDDEDWKYARIFLSQHHWCSKCDPRKKNQN